MVPLHIIKKFPCNLQGADIIWLSHLCITGNTPCGRSSAPDGRCAVPFLTLPAAAKKRQPYWIVFFTETGNDLLSQAAARQVSSALGSLTAVFEMGTGVPSPL